MDKKEFLLHLLGEGSPALFAAAVFYAFVGAFLMLLLSTTKRDPNSPRTPYHFSWDFLWSDNTKRVVATILLILVALRFSREFLGAQLTMWLALLIGLGCDRLAQLLKEKNILGIGK